MAISELISTKASVPKKAGISMFFF